MIKFLLVIYDKPYYLDLLKYEKCNYTWDKNEGITSAKNTT